MKTLRFSHHKPGGDRRHYVTEDDVRIVLDRLPAAGWKRLKTVHFNDRWRGHCLGYVTRGRDAISLCALPPRISFNATLTRRQSPAPFGAIRGCQWPPLAVRRLMLYQVLLHEVGHLQLVNARARSNRRRFADETLAQEFAEYWCRELWSQPFDHPDPVHNPASPRERQTVRDQWAVLTSSTNGPLPAIHRPIRT